MSTELILCYFERNVPISFLCAVLSVCPPPGIQVYLLHLLLSVPCLTIKAKELLLPLYIVTNRWIDHEIDFELYVT